MTPPHKALRIGALGAISLVLVVGLAETSADGASTGQPTAARAAAAPPAALPAAAPAPLNIRTVDIRAAQVRSGGERGPAAASLPDGRVLLGGGASGRMLMLWNPSNGRLTTVGQLIRANQRRTDSRFAPTDIEVMRVKGSAVRLFVSFPEWVPSSRCVRVAVNRVNMSLKGTPRITSTSKVLRTKPCVGLSAVQHASGRLARINNTTAYVTVGDLGYPRINNRKARGQLGSIFKIAKGKKAKRISQGHRNGQGLVLDSRGRLWETEHGPRGGDELNLISTGKDYGWPFVTLGQPYGSGDYVRPSRTATHSGFTAPRTAWVPSVATSEIVQVPASWSGWNGATGADLLMGTLKDESLWRIRVDAGNRVIQRQRIAVNHRVRDLEVRPDGSLAATTDDGRLLLITV